MSADNPPPPIIEARGPEGQVLAHTDITDVSPLLESADALSQSELIQGMLLEDGRVQLGPDIDFTKQPVRTVLFSELERNFERKNKHAAMQLLRGRSKIGFELGDIWDADDPEVSFSPNKNRLDFIACSSLEPGLDAILPNSTVDHNYNFDFTINQRHKVWKAKYAELGFSPTGRMLHVGKAQGQNIWLAFVPVEYWNEESRNADYDEDSLEDNTLIPTDRYRKVAYLMAHLFAHAGIAGVYNSETYSRNLSSKETNGWKADTNLL